jgi:YHS domain-containing protein
VSILDGNRWVRGRPELVVLHDGREYHFAGGPQRQAFLANPTKYVPALGGDCPVSYRDHGERIEGSVYHAVIHRGRQYLFAGLPQKELFKQNPDAYADADLALGGNCAVSLVDAQEEVRGKSEFMAWHRGLRFYFAGPEQLAAFETDPAKYADAAQQ